MGVEDFKQLGVDLAKTIFYFQDTEFVELFNKETTQYM
jgi:hypothetical protein